MPSGEVRDPARTVPRSMFLALVITTLLYLLLQLVANAVLGPSLASFVDAPLAEVASRVFGPVGRSVILLGASISMLGFLSSDALSTPRSLYAFARDGLSAGPAGPSASTISHAVAGHRRPRRAGVGARVGRQFRSPGAAVQRGRADVAICCAAWRRSNSGAATCRRVGGRLCCQADRWCRCWPAWYCCGCLSHATAQEFLVTGGALLVAALLFAWRGLTTRTPLVGADGSTSTNQASIM